MFTFTDTIATNNLVCMLFHVAGGAPEISPKTYLSCPKQCIIFSPHFFLHIYYLLLNDTIVYAIT